MKVKAPKGYHWMKSGKGAPKLMKHKGKFVPHKGASLSFNFAIHFMCFHFLYFLIEASHGNFLLLVSILLLGITKYFIGLGL